MADFDGDGRPEFAAAGRGYYAVYDLDCAGDPVPTEWCATGRDDGILWSVVVQDLSSSVTGSSVFDFEGDGKAEVVYNDECHLYILSGEDGFRSRIDARIVRLHRQVQEDLPPP